MSTIA